MTDSCETSACEILKNNVGNTYDRDEATARAEAQRKIAETALMQMKSKIDPVVIRSRDVHMHYIDGRMRTAIINEMKKVRDAVLAEDPRNPLEEEDAARKTYLKEYFEMLPDAFFYRAVAEGLTETQMSVAFKNTMHRLKEKGFDPAITVDEKIPDALVHEARDSRLENEGNNPIKNDIRIQLRETTLPNITRVLVGCVLENVPNKEGEPARYDEAQFKAVTDLHLGYLLQLHADRAYVRNSFEAPKDENTVINEYIEEAAGLLLKCITTKADRLLVHKAMEAAL